MINFRSINDLNETVKKSLSMVPKDVGLIVGIPRSGLLAANLIALHLNLPLTDLEGLIENRIVKTGERKLREDSCLKNKLSETKILVVDDSLLTGSTMRSVKDKIKKAGLKNEIVFCAIFTSPENRSEVDLYLEEIRGYRIFEWNLMHSSVITNSCVDIDGVICVDPTEDQNDDGMRYKEFLKNATPLHLPSEKIGYLVSCRLEKYRTLTEQWLRKHKIEYGKLYMMDLPNKRARVSSGSHAKFKANIYKLTDAKLFIESSLRQANEIAKLSNRPVLCVESNAVVYPAMVSYAVKKVLDDPLAIRRRLLALKDTLKRWFFDIDPPKRLS